MNDEITPDELRMMADVWAMEDARSRARDVSRETSGACHFEEEDEDDEDIEF